MTRMVFFCVLTLLPWVGFSQALPTEAHPQDRITKIVHVQYGNPSKIVDLVRSGTAATVTGDNTLKVVVISGPPDLVEATRHVVKELDVPLAISSSNDIELTVYVLGASNEATSSTANELAAIAPVVKQLRAIFPYKDYDLLSTMLLRSRQGTPAGSSGVMSYHLGSASQWPSTYRIGYDRADASTEKGQPTIHLDHFSFSAKMILNISTTSNTSQVQSVDLSTGSAVDLREGQKVVVGKADVANDGSALFIVLSAKLVD